MDSWSNIYEKASVGRPQSSLTSPACVNYISCLQTTAICYQPSGHQYFLYYAPHLFLGKSWATYDRACIRNGSRLFGSMHIAKTKIFPSAENFPLRIFDGMCLPIRHLKGNSFRAGLKTPGEGAELRNEIYLNAAFFFLLAFCFAESITRLD